MRPLLLIVAVLIAFPAHAQRSVQWDPWKPIWKQSSSLLCRATERHFCHLDRNCNRDDPTTTLKVDFKSGLVSYFGSDNTEKILSKNDTTYVGGVRTAVLLSDSRLMEFKFETDRASVTAWSTEVPDAGDTTPVPATIVVLKWLCYAS